MKSFSAETPTIHPIHTIHMTQARAFVVSSKRFPLYMRKLGSESQQQNN